MHVMRDTEAWLSWLEHTVHIREVTGSSPVASTTLYQSAPVADWFFILFKFFCINLIFKMIDILQRNMSLFFIKRKHICLL